VVDQVLVTQCNPEHPLTHQTLHLVDHQVGRTVIGEAASKALDQSDLPIGRAKQHRPGLRGHHPTVKRRYHLPPFNGCKAKQICATLCLHRDAPWSGDKPFVQLDFLRSRAPMHLPPLRNAG
jgi:hypothetical protein